MLDLPKEVVIAIVSFLNRNSKFSFASTCKYSRFLILSFIENFSVSYDALESDTCFLKYMSNLRMLSVIGDTSSKMCHSVSLRMLCKL